MFPALELAPVDLITKVSFDPAPIVFVVASTVWYLLAARRVGIHGQPWSRIRTAIFCLGELALAVATISGLNAYNSTNFVVQAVNYSIVGMGVPVLFALGAPVTLALRSGGPRTRSALSSFLHSRAARLLVNPMVVWPLYVIPLFVLYLSGLCGDGSRNPAVDQVIYLGLLVTGCIFCWAIVGVDPVPRRLGTWYRIAWTALSLPIYSVLGMALQSQSSTPARNITLNDLHTGGGVAWTIGETIGVLGAIAIFVQWLRTDERAARKVDQISEEAAEEQLAHWRAARDAAARSIID